jgi:translation elongation factor EF-G
LDDGQAEPPAPPVDEQAPVLIAPGTGTGTGAGTGTGTQEEEERPVITAAGAGYRGAHDSAVVNGFQLAAGAGPLCDEPLRGVALFVEGLDVAEGADEGGTRARERERERESPHIGTSTDTRPGPHVCTCS